jgi:hypothetical protein
MADTTLQQDPDEQNGNGDGLIPVPLDTLKRGGVAPQEGDTVKFTVEGTVDHVDEQAGFAYVEPEKANGKEIPESSDDQDEDMTEEGLQKKAEQADQEGGGYG